MITTTLVMAGILALALVAPATSGASVTLIIIALIAIILYGIYESICNNEED